MQKSCGSAWDWQEKSSEWISFCSFLQFFWRKSQETTFHPPASVRRRRKSTWQRRHKLSIKVGDKISQTDKSFLVLLQTDPSAVSSGNTNKSSLAREKQTANKTQHLDSVCVRGNFQSCILCEIIIFRFAFSSPSFSRQTRNISSRQNSEENKRSKKKN